MADLSIRGVPEEVHATLKEKAASDGKSLEMWLRERLAMLARQPVVKHRYILKAFGPEAAYAQIRRLEDDMGGGAKNLSQGQMDAYRLAQEYVKRNAPGDRENAHDLLSKHFETVFETLM